MLIIYLYILPITYFFKCLFLKQDTIISCINIFIFASYFRYNVTLNIINYARCVIFVLVQPLHYLFSAWLTLIILLVARVPQYFQRINRIIKLLLIFRCSKKISFLILYYLCYSICNACHCSFISAENIAN